jgi:osmotically-inducible protein OsmY
MVDLEQNHPSAERFSAPERPNRWRDRGPRAYRRRDESMREGICESLTENPDLDSDDIEVSVEGGEGTLPGSAEGRDARSLAQNLAEAVAGVRAVHNHLRVAHG